jgi:hypothetical protein
MPEISKHTSTLGPGHGPSRPASGEKRESYLSWMGANTAFVDALSQASQTYMSRFSALNEEILGFAAGRLQKVSEIGESLMKCKDITDALRIQQDWLRQTTEQYVQEASKIFEMTTKAALASVNPVIEQASRIAEKTAEKTEDLRKAS